MTSTRAPMPTLEEKRTLSEAVNEALHAKGSSLTLWLFTIAATCFVTNALFYAHTLFDTFALTTTQTLYCAAPELEAAKWPSEQIRNLTLASDDGCSVYAFDFAKMTKISLSDAVAFVLDSDEPEVKTCGEIGGKIRYDGGDNANYATEWDLVCDKEETASRLSLAFYTGCIYGGVLLGIVGDLFGRKFVFNISILPLIIVTFVTSLAQSTTVYFIARFIAGFFGFGISNTFFVLLIENCEGRWREILAVVYSMAYAVGLFGLSGIVAISAGAHGMRVVEFALGIMTLVVVVVCRFIPESPRFLMSRNKHAKAFESLHSFEPDTKMFLSESSVDKPENSLKSLASVVSISCALLYSFWFLAFNYSDMNISLLLEDIPQRAKVYATYDLIGYFASIPLLIFMPRKRLMSAALITFGAVMILTAALPVDGENDISQAMLNVCRSFGNPVLVVLSLHIVELFPTRVRNTAYGAVSSLGYVVTLYAVDIVEAFTRMQDKFQLPSAMTMFGLLSIFMCSIAYTLPETKSKRWESVDGGDDHQTVTMKKREDSCHDSTIKSISFSAMLFVVVVLLLFVNFLIQ